MTPPPTSIDGTDITGATIDGQDVEEITVDGQTVFAASNPIENFETGNLNNYSSSSVFFVQSSDAFEGTFAMETSGSNGDIFTNNPPSGNVATFGTDFEFYAKAVDADTRMLISYESDGTKIFDGARNGYIVDLFNTGGGSLQATGSINAFDDAVGRVSSDFNVNADIWYRIEATFSGSTVTYTVIDTNTNVTEASVSHGSFNSPGTGIALGTRGGGILVGRLDGWAEI